MGGPSIPKAAPPPPPPDYADQAVRDAALGERQKQLSQASRRKSFVSGGSSASSSGGSTIPVVDAKRLLGG